MSLSSTYLLYGYFGAGNFGDDILLHVVMRNIVKFDPDAHFIIRNYGPVESGSEFSNRISYADFEKIHKQNKSAIAKLFSLIRSYWVHLGRASTLVVGGGTLIHDKPSLRATFLLMCLCLIARIRNRKVIGVGIGAQDLKSFSGMLVYGILGNLFHRLNLRDERSYRQFKSLIIGSTRLKLTTDLAYTLPAVNAKPERKVIAITLVAYIFGRLDQKDHDKAYKILGNVLTKFIEEGYSVKFLSLQKVRSDLDVGGDSVILQRLIDQIPAPLHRHCELRELEASEGSIAACFDGVSLMMGMRFHSLVFAALQSIPFVGLGDEPKVEELCEEYKMPCLAFPRWEKELSDSMNLTFGKRIDPSLLARYHRLALDNFEYFQ